jgi:nucleotide-binding universal stress UspA family protein
MKKILVAVDFSEDTAPVPRYALELARHENSEICLIHSYFDRMVLTESTFPGSIEAETMINEKLLIESHDLAVERMETLSSGLREEAVAEGIDGLIISTQLEGGEPSFAIVEYCQEFTPDLIVMGTRGSGRKGFLEGSVSKKVMNNAGIPVLAIPSRHSFQGFSSVLYLSNFDDYDARALMRLLDIFRHFDVCITVLHLVSENRIDDAKEEMDGLRRYFLEQEDKGLMQFLLKEKKDYGQDVLEFTNKNNIGLISFIPHKHNFLEGFFRSVMTKKDLYEANIPMLAIPKQD